MIEVAVNINSLFTYGFIIILVGMAVYLFCSERFLTFIQKYVELITERKKSLANTKVLEIEAETGLEKAKRTFNS